MADSISERIVDNWLHDHGLVHEKNKKYPNSKMNCDFYLIDHDIWIEYFGLIGVEEYDKGVEIKKDVAKDNGLTLISLTPDDLYPTIGLDNIFKKYEM